MTEKRYSIDKFIKQASEKEILDLYKILKDENNVTFYNGEKIFASKKFPNMCWRITEDESQKEYLRKIEDYFEKDISQLL